MKQRIYVVTIGECDRLVRASHPNGALMHVMRDIACASVATQDELVELLADGVEVEQARPEPVNGTKARFADGAAAAITDADADADGDAESQPEPPVAAAVNGTAPPTAPARRSRTSRAAPQPAQPSNRP